MEVGPTCHYVMGGVEVEPDTALQRGGPVRVRRVAGACTLQPAGRQLAVRPAGVRPAGRGRRVRVRRRGRDSKPVIAESDVDAASRRRWPTSRRRGRAQENPYSVHTQLQQTMNDLVGIIRRGGEVEQAWWQLDELKQRARNIVVEGHRQFNPGWHLASTCATCCWSASAWPRPRCCAPRAAGTPARTTGDGRRLAQAAAGVQRQRRGTGVDVTPKDQIPLRPDLRPVRVLGAVQYFTPGELADIPAKER